MSTSFSIKGKGLKLTSAADIQPYIDELVALGPDVEEVHLGGNTLGIEACESLAKVLEGLKKLKIADFADIFTGRLISEIPTALTALCTSLSHTTTLETLDLSDNAFGGRCAEPIVPFLLTNLSFHHFILNNNGLGPTGGLIIAQALLDAANNSKKASGKEKSELRTFVCGRNRLENGSSELLSQAFEAHGGLEVVRLPQNGIRMEGIEALSKGLSANPNLTTLDLQDNTFTLPGSLALTSSLASWPNLTELNLSDCLLSRRGGIALATKLAEGTNPKLEVVKLQYGEMDKRTFVLLEKAVRLHGKGIKTLELNGNLVDAEDEIVEKIREALTENGHEDALDELDDMEEDEGEDSDADEDDAVEEASDVDEEKPPKPTPSSSTTTITTTTTSSSDSASVPAPAQSSASAPAPEPKENILEMSVDAMADALAQMSVKKE